MSGSNIFQHQSTVWAGDTGDQAALVALRDVALVAGSDGALAAQVVSGPHPALQLTAWAAGAAHSFDSTARAASGLAGTEPMLVTGITGDWRGFTLISGGGASLAGVWHDSAGGMGGGLPLGSSGAVLPNDLTALDSAPQGSGALIFGLYPGSQSPTVWSMSASGALSLRSPGSVASSVDGIAAPGLTDLAVVGDHLVAGGTGSRLVRLYRISDEGTLLSWDSIRLDDNPGMSGHITVAGGTVAGNDYAIVGAAGSGTLSVYRITDTSHLELTDHVIDTLDTRFAGVSQLDVIERDGALFVVAGGSDDGVSLFQLLPGGTLQHLGVQADTQQTALGGAFSLDLGLNSDGSLVLAVAGEGDQGLSLFHHNPGPQGAALQASAPGGTLVGSNSNDQLIGGTGDDVLRGQGGTDILMDGAGADTLTGGTGADTFVFVTDGTQDRVADFNPAQDHLDLSGWAFYRNTGQLQINARVDGAEIVFDGPAGREVLRLVSHDGAPLDPNVVRATILSGPSRFLPEWLDTEALRTDPDPDDQARRVNGTPRDDALSGGTAGDTVSGGAGSDRLDGGMGADQILGGIGWDTLLGGAGDDSLRGLDGWDSLNGGTGNDTLYGNNGQDLAQGAEGADLLYGGLGGDTLQGGDGDDVLRGDAGSDLLEGGADEDALAGNAGTDLLRGGLGDDTLEGGINHDTLEGGFGDDLLLAGNGTDSLNGGAGNDTLFGNAGNDRLDGGGGWDVLNGGIGADTFVFRGGTVVVEDFQDNIDTLVLDRDLWGGGNRTSSQILSDAQIIGGDLVLDFGGMGRLVLEDVSRIGVLSNDLGLE